MSTSELKFVAETREKVQTAANINKDLAEVEKQLESGQLRLGPVANVISAVRNETGRSTPQSQNFALLKSTLERLRNESLRLNAGVQTDGDAQRAWNELMSSINDPGVVRAQLARIQEINRRAVQLHQQTIEDVMGNRGREAPPAPVTPGGAGWSITPVN